MATGINSIAMHRAGHDSLSATLLAIGTLAFLVLAALTVVRAARFRAELTGDLTNPRKLFGAFTLVAGVDVLAGRCAIGGAPRLAAALLAIGILAWLVFGYATPAIILVKRSEGPVLGAVDGTWFIAVVATQSVALGATALEPSFPGAERVLTIDGVRVGVLEGDVQGSMDADRLASLHVPVTQLNTDPGFGGECHLDANMVRSAIPSLPLATIDLLVIENVGNLVCPAEFRVGEDHRVMITSVTEGEDKPLKYPLMFRACELVVINKIDLLPHLEVDLNRLLSNIDCVHPGVRCMLVSARTGEGLDTWCEWLWSRVRQQAILA